MTLNKSLIALKDDATEGFLNVVDPALISKAQDNATKKEFARSIVVLDNKVTYVTPEEYGAVGDGVEDDSAAIQAAIDTETPVYFSKKTYLVEIQLTLTNNTFLIGSGNESILKTTQDIRIIDIKGDFNSITGLTFQGNDTGLSQVGVNVEGDAGLTLSRVSNRLTNCSFYNFGLSGVRVRNMKGALGANNDGAFIAVSCVFEDNNIGINLEERGEYNNFTNCKVRKNAIGVLNQGGNNSFVGGVITNNTVGFNLINGSNDGHSVCSSTMINHNTQNILAVDLAGNYLFSNCMFYAGEINIDDCFGVRFESCEFSSWSFIGNRTRNTLFNNCWFNTVPTSFTTAVFLPIISNSFFNGQAPTNMLPFVVDNKIFVFRDLNQGSTPYDLQTKEYSLQSYPEGLRFRFKALATNTGASTLYIRNLPILPFKNGDGSELSAGQITAGSFVEVVYNGSFFQLLT